MNQDLSASVKERYLRILDRVVNAANKCGRASDEIRVVAVSKSRPVGKIQAAIAAGVNTFGENYVDEAVEKIASVGKITVEWHMIGHVQSRKAEAVARNFAMLHSLDSLKLARRLEQFCSMNKRVLPVLLEFNVSGEESKFGFPAWRESSWADLEDEIGQILELAHLKVVGLMTMPPYFDDMERTRPYFQRLRNLQEYLIEHFPIGEWKELSMGTSVDFVAAIQEGATFVRIGQAIFGPRS